MKEITGYLIDRTTGLGISGKAVSFLKLDGTAVPATATGLTTGSKDTITASDGKFSAWWELSPGPVNVLVDVSASEKKIRKHNEKAQLGMPFSSDLLRLSRMSGPGFVRGVGGALGITLPGGHTIRISTGIAMMPAGGVFSIENGYIDLTGTANSNAAINPRIDLITLRQYNEDAAGQNAGRQTIIITEGSTTNVAPATPTGSDFRDLPIGTVATAYLGSTKTEHSDLRGYINSTSTDMAPKNFSQAMTTLFLTNSYQTWLPGITTSGLDPNRVYDGELIFSGIFDYALSGGGLAKLQASISDSSLLNSGWPLGTVVAGAGDDTASTNRSIESFHFSWPIIGLTGVTGNTYGPTFKTAIFGPNVAITDGIMQVRLRPRP